MKYHFPFLIITCLCLFACSSDSQKIVGEWQGDEFTYLGAEIDDELMETATEIALSYNYVFNDDGSVIFNDFLNFERNGTWEVDGDQLTITMEIEPEHNVFPDGERETTSSYTIEYLGSNTLILVEENGESKISFQKK